jgi:hypothetical protein
MIISLPRRDFFEPRVGMIIEINSGAKPLFEISNHCAEVVLTDDPGLCFVRNLSIS